MTIENFIIYNDVLEVTAAPEYELSAYFEREVTKYIKPRWWQFWKKIEIHTELQWERRSTLLPAFIAEPLINESTYSQKMMSMLYCLGGSKYKHVNLCQIANYTKYRGVLA